MIIINGEPYRTLKDPIYENGKRVLKAFVNGEQVYPDNKYEHGAKGHVVKTYSYIPFSIIYRIPELNTLNRLQEGLWQEGYTTQITGWVKFIRCVRDPLYTFTYEGDFSYYYDHSDGEYNWLNIANSFILDSSCNGYIGYPLDTPDKRFFPLMRFVGIQNKDYGFNNLYDNKTYRTIAHITFSNEEGENVTSYTDFHVDSVAFKVHIDPFLVPAHSKRTNVFYRYNTHDSARMSYDNVFFNPVIDDFSSLNDKTFKYNRVHWRRVEKNDTIVRLRYGSSHFYFPDGTSILKSKLGGFGEDELCINPHSVVFKGEYDKYNYTPYLTTIAYPNNAIDAYKSYIGTNRKNEPNVMLSFILSRKSAGIRTNMVNNLGNAFPDEILDLRTRVFGMIVSPMDVLYIGDDDSVDITEEDLSLLD